MRLQILGTAACEGVPAAFCRCEVCRRSREEGGRALRTRSQLYVDNNLLVDFPADTYMHSVTYGFSLADIKHILFTHSHPDHLYPQEFYNRGGMYSAGTVKDRVTVYGSEITRERFTAQYGNTPNKTIDWHIVKPYVSFQCADKKITPLPVIHACDEQCYIYLIENGKRVLYATDAEGIDGNVLNYLCEKKTILDVVIMDCTRAGLEKDSGRHMNAADNIELVDRLNAVGLLRDKARLVSTHFSHNGGWTHYDAERELKKSGIEAAYDGMTIEL